MLDEIRFGWRTRECARKNKRFGAVIRDIEEHRDTNKTPQAAEEETPRKIKTKR